MLRKKFSSVIVMAIIFLFISTAILKAQPLSKRNVKISFKEQQAKQTLIPFEYDNYKKAGPLSKNVYTRVRKTGEKSKIAFAKTAEQKYSGSFFLKQKRHSANIQSENKSSLVGKKKAEGNFFLKQKRHQ